MVPKTVCRRNYRCDENYSPLSQESRAPPWCSLGRVCERRKPRKVAQHSIKSFCPLREHIYEYLDDDTARKFDFEKSGKKCTKQTVIKRSKSGNTKLLVLFLLALGVVFSYFVRNNIPGMDQLTSILSKTNFISFSDIDLRVNEECCHRTKHLTLALNKAEQALRYSPEIIMLHFDYLEWAIRHRKTISMLHNINAETSRSKSIDTGYISGATAMKGSDTTEWGGNVAFWGVLPLWRNSPPPDTVLQLRRPTPSDCWPFRGSYGEIIIELRQQMHVDRISLEHIRPDSARSAPKHFMVYGIVGNGTWIKAADGVYRDNKPAKQYFHLDNRNIPFQQIVFKILSNQGNSKYTCVYRIHLYTNIVKYKMNQ